MATHTTNQPENNRRVEEVHQFESTKLGVKGLVDSGITRIPTIFHHPPETQISLPSSDTDPDPTQIPVVDLSRPESELVGQVREAASKYGFFQVVNHGVPLSLVDRVVDRVRGFHEMTGEEKMRYYSRDAKSGVTFFSNVDLFVSKAASWRDTLQVRLNPPLADVDLIPSICRDEILEWDKEVEQLGERLMGLLSGGLGVSADRLKKLSCLEGRVMAAHYYPYCPEPEKTVGLASHKDPGILTVLLQGPIGGLQIKHDGKWISVNPIHGALVINVGDLLQILSNEEYVSVDHRVYANSCQEPRVSIAVFLNPGNREDLYGPMPELVTPEKPALYRQFKYIEFMTRFFSRELDGKSLANFFRSNHQ